MNFYLYPDGPAPDQRTSKNSKVKEEALENSIFIINSKNRTRSESKRFQFITVKNGENLV